MLQEVRGLALTAVRYTFQNIFAAPNETFASALNFSFSFPSENDLTNFASFSLFLFVVFLFIVCLWI
jgi:hypothetical protein